MSMPKLVDATLEMDNRIAVLTLNRDDVRNALTGTGLIDDIVDTVSWANTSDEVSVLVITGAGSAFSAGGNVKEIKAKSGIFSGPALAIQDQYRRGIQRIPMALHQAEIPVIAAVNGPAIGAGFDLACMCDLRLGSTRTRFGETYIDLGIIPGAGGAWILQRLIGYQKAVELTLTGRVISAEEGLELGLLLRICEPEELLPQALALAEEIAQKPPLTVRLTKRLLKMAQREELRDFLDLSACFQAMVHHTEDHMEAITAFLEKKKPTYFGR